MILSLEFGLLIVVIGIIIAIITGKPKAGLIIALLGGGLALAFYFIPPLRALAVRGLPFPFP